MKPRPTQRDRAAERAALRAAFIKAFLRSKPRCECCRILDPTRPPRPATEVHERLSRARGGSPLEADNAMAVCGWCHRWIHDHPAEAMERGWLVSQFGGDDE